MNLVVGNVYVGRHHKPAWYLGLEPFEETGQMLHQFEYIETQYGPQGPGHGGVGGYGQTDEQVKFEQYVLDRNMTVLYGRKSV